MTSGASDDPPMPPSTMWFDAVGDELLAQRDDVVDQRARDGDRLGPAEALRGLGLGVRAPERGVLSGDAARDEVAHELRHDAVDGLGRRTGRDDLHAHLAASSAAVTVSSSSFQETMNLSTPSFSSSAVTSSYEMPTAAEGVELGLRRGVLAGDPVALDHAVVERGLEGLLGHRVDGVRHRELGDVERVGQVRVLDAGRGPQRALLVRAGGEQRLGALGGERLLEDLVGELRVGDAGLALERERLRVPIASRRLSISVSTRDTKNDATEWIVERSMPAALRAARGPSR